MTVTKELSAPMPAPPQHAEVRGLTARACGKINLTLDVLGRRDDGFHELRSLVIGVDLADRVRCVRRSAGGIVLRCSDPALAGSENLTVRAAQAFAQRAGCKVNLAIELDKRIPVAAGMGGGSSDAAATLLLCNDLFLTGLSTGELARMGAEIGSDVPLFFHLPAVLMTGRGDVVASITLRWSAVVWPASCCTTSRMLS